MHNSLWLASLQPPFAAQIATVLLQITTRLAGQVAPVHRKELL